MSTVRFATESLLLRFAAGWLAFAAFTTWMTSAAHAREATVLDQGAKPEKLMAPNPVTLKWQSLPATVHLAEGDWLFNRSFSRNRPRTRAAKPRRTDREFRRGNRAVKRSKSRRTGSGRKTARGKLTGGYSTVCVRLCDGYFYPISHSANRSRFMADHAYCENSCKAPSKLFVHATGTDIDQSYDLMGKRYTSLPNAFLYRKEYVSDCQCKADPWTKEAKALHHHYAALADAFETEPGAIALTPTIIPSRDIAGNFSQTRKAKPKRRILGWSSDRVSKYRRRSPQRAKPSRARRPASRSPAVPFWKW